MIQTIPKSGYRLIAPLERAARSATKGSLLVLPFASSGSDPSLEYLADGITDAIIRTLAQLPHLRVIARSTAYRYRDRNAHPEAVGRELHVAAVLTGQIISRGDALTFVVELVDVAHGSLLWAERYVHKLADVSALEDEIAARISDTLAVTLTGEQRNKITRRSRKTPPPTSLISRAATYGTKARSTPSPKPSATSSRPSPRTAITP